MLYDDDGITQSYLFGEKQATLITSNLSRQKNLTVRIEKTMGTFSGMLKNQSTTLYLNTNAKPKCVSAFIDGKQIVLKEATKGDNTWNYVQSPNLNRFSTAGTEIASLLVSKNAQIIVRLGSCDITTKAVELRVDGFERLNKSNQSLSRKR